MPPPKPISKALWTKLPRAQGSPSPIYGSLLDLSTVAANVRPRPFPRIRFTPFNSRGRTLSGGVRAVGRPHMRVPSSSVGQASQQLPVGQPQLQLTVSPTIQQSVQPRPPLERTVSQGDETRLETSVEEKTSLETEHEREARLEADNAALRLENAAMRRRLAQLYAVMRSGASYEAARGKLRQISASRS